jgi:hypothetical protein
MSEIGGLKHIFLCEVIVLVSIVLLLKVACLPERWSTTIVALVLIPICFLTTSAFSAFDYGFVFSPALRLIHGFNVREIYFQYDLFLSLLAAGWMKLHFDINNFRFVAQASVYILIFIEFIVSKRLFFTKKLAYFFLAALVLIKIYAYFIDPTYCIQLTPLRLDLWIIPFIILMWRGSYSIAIGCCFLVINIVHRNFGFLYSISYLEFIFVLFLIDLFENYKVKIDIIKLVRKHIFLTGPNLILIGVSLFIDYYIFGSLRPESAILYQQLGIGFLPISAVSFYWYVPILLTATFVLLFKQRKSLPDYYFTSGVFLILLSLANSVYFFGRSHESNIIHISGSLLFLVFMLIDLLIKNYSVKKENILDVRTIKYNKYILGFMPIFFIMLITFYYSERITRNLIIHAQNLRDHRFQYTNQYNNPIQFNKDSTDLKTITHNTDKVYMLSNWDFYYYYYGNYVPQGYFLPYVSSPFKKDLLVFLQNLLNKNYYIVIRKDELSYEAEVVNALAYNHTNDDNMYKVIWK